MPTVICNTLGGGRGVRKSFIWPKRVRAVQQCVVFRVLRLQNRVYNFTF